MSSKNPEELRGELEGIDACGDEELLTILRSEARETVDAQRETLSDIDTKAIRILRLNVLLIGVITSALSITSSGSAQNATASGVDPLLNQYTRVGFGALVLSTALAAVTYTASELDVGVSSRNLVTLLEADLQIENASELLVKNHAVRINFNRSTNIRNIPLITSTVVFVVAGVLFFALGAYEAVIGPVSSWLSGLAFSAIFGVVIASGMVTQTVRALRDVYEWR